MKRRHLELINDPKHWRARASEMRSVAAKATDPKVKATTSGAADAYEDLAKGSETRKAASGTR